jgi:putative hydrolase of the HAD superfamily
MTREVCVVFDIDDTLYLESEYVRSGFEAVGRWAWEWLCIEDFAERCWKRFVLGTRGSIFNAVLQETRGESAPELVSALVEMYRTHAPAIALTHDAQECLAALRSMVSIAVISDGPIASQSRKAEALGLRRFADPLILTEIPGREFRKPHPLAFHQVEQCQPAKLYLYVADNPLKDFSAPKQLGWTTIRVRRQGGQHSDIENSELLPDYEMADCSALPGLLRSL